MNTRQLRQKILDLAIRGKLVSQDPNDEPASALLRQIKSTQTTQIKQKNTDKKISENQSNQCAPFEIPESWKWCRLGEIGNWSTGTTPSRLKIKYYENGTIPWLKTGDLNDGKIIKVSEYVTESALNECKQLKINPIGSVVIALYGATIGKCGILDIETTTNQACCVCKTHPIIFNKYLFFFLLSQREQLKEKAEGGAQPNISKEKIVSSFIPLPPLSEQRRIVSVIVSAFALIDEIEANKLSLAQLIKQTKSKVFDLAISGKLVPNESITNDELRMMKSSTLAKEDMPFEIPKSWEWYKFCEISSIARGGSPRPIKDYLTDSGNGINWIKIGDTEKGGKYIFTTQEKIVKEGIKHSRFVNIDDFLLTNSMSFGRPYILKTDGCIHDGWLVISIDKQMLNQDFMYYLLSSGFMYEQFSNVAVGSTVKNLKIESVQQIPFPLPPLSEQHRIVEKIETIFEALDVIQSNL